MHVGFLTVGGQKMSKSTGNFITISDFLKRCPANYLRFFVVRNLWRSPVDYSESTLIDVKSTVEKIEEFLRKIKAIKTVKSSKEVVALVKNLPVKFYKELDDDFNTPNAFAILFGFISASNPLLEQNLISKKDATEIYKFFTELNDIFGIIDFKKVNKTIPAEIKKLVKERELARQNKEWQKSDEIRAQIERKGFVVEDKKDGPIVKSI